MDDEPTGRAADARHARIRKTADGALPPARLRILKLRELDAAMDEAVLDAYDWSDAPTACEFLLDYEIDEEEWGAKKPWRYRWPGSVRSNGRTPGISARDRARESIDDVLSRTWLIEDCR